eukprot:GEMP01019099.1.p1 GENE.GEMP01019099.1~~GEMP01019099.1.p1  ORF type:complete len:553 (+),score=153.66 GEMP01019099.1:193-1659(+)
MWCIISIAVAIQLRQPVSQNLRQRISGDSSKLGKVAESLLGVQNDINRVEKEVMGKVFDLQTVREFFTTHQALEVERDELAKNSEELQTTIAHLSDQVAREKAQATAQAKEAAHELALKASQVSDLQVHIQTLQEELEKRKSAEADKATLVHLNQVLRDQLTTTTVGAEKLQREAVAAHKTIQDHAAEIMKLSAELIKQHTYGENCHLQVTQMDQRFAAQLQRENAEHAATKAAADHAQTAAAAAQQQLLADKKLLEQQVANQETVVQTQAVHVSSLSRQLTTATAALAVAQENARKEVQQLKFHEGSLRTQLRTCDDSLMQNVDARNMADKQLHECKQKLLGGKEQMLEMQLGQCTDFQKKVSASLNTAQLKLATCTADKDQAINARKAGEEQLKIMKKSARKTSEEAQAQVVAKTKEAAKYQEEAQKAIMEAEAQLSAKCGLVWKKKNKKVSRHLKECKVTKEDLRMAEAQTLTLEQSLKACMQTQ